MNINNHVYNETFPFKNYINYKRFNKAFCDSIRRFLWYEYMIWIYYEIKYKNIV